MDQLVEDNSALIFPSFKSSLSRRHGAASGMDGHCVEYFVRDRIPQYDNRPTRAVGVEGKNTERCCAEPCEKSTIFPSSLRRRAMSRSTRSETCRAFHPEDNRPDKYSSLVAPCGYPQNAVLRNRHNPIRQDQFLFPGLNPDRPTHRFAVRA